MELRTACSPKDVKHYTTERLRDEFLVQGLFTPDEIKLVYSHIDRIIIGAATPVNKKLVLTAGEELRAEYFLQRRELGVINIGGAGKITIDGKVYNVAPREEMCIRDRGRGSHGLGPPLSCVSLPVLCGGKAGGLSEDLTEIIPTGKAAGEGDFLNRKRSVQQEKDGMGQADTIEADKGCLPCFTGKQPGKIRRRKSQPACQFLHGKTPVKVFLHISDAFRNRSRWLKKGRGFQRAQQAGKEAVDQFAAFVAFQLTAFP